MAITKTTRRRKSKIVPSTNTELKLKDFFKALYNSEAYIHIKYILDRLFYLCQTLIIGWLIQYVWNFAMIKWFEGEYQVNLFEAAILWICVY